MGAAEYPPVCARDTQSHTCMHSWAIRAICPPELWKKKIKKKNKKKLWLIHKHSNTEMCSCIKKYSKLRKIQYSVICVCCVCVRSMPCIGMLCVIGFWRSLGGANLQRELDRITHNRDCLHIHFIYITSHPLPLWLWSKAFRLHNNNA